MNKKAQLNIGAILLAFIGIIVGLALLTAISISIGSSTTTYVHNDTADGTSTTFSASGTPQDLEGQDLIGTITVINATGTEVLELDQSYNVTEIVSTSTGVKTISITNQNSTYDSNPVNLTYTYGPEGYINNSGARAVASLIIIFMVLAIAVIALVPSLRSGVIDMVN